LRELRGRLVQILEASWAAESAKTQLVQTCDEPALVAHVSKPIPLSEVLETANLPRWKNGWADSEGNHKKGFWYVWFDGKKVSLTKYGAPDHGGGKPNGEPGRAELKAAIAARDRYLAEYVTRKAKEFNEKQSGQGAQVRVVDCMNYYITHHLSKVKNTKERRRYCENFATGRDGGKNGIHLLALDRPDFKPILVAEAEFVPAHQYMLAIVVHRNRRHLPGPCGGRQDLALRQVADQDPRGGLRSAPRSVPVQ
jgi:hypothetical protein